ncbi:hypothetical protein [Microlunatus antarcticus]|uniref:DUF1772 domain-containing protein n=1 Tax=Microlunatus antarcticus TaxID=53388 RepID=A0A7W5JYK9_9ACTN|nr:hypothetical protein [Microlunatus antarcticus]MBB3328052.1 hypothetical protein [Microlunatus antarcticus]
MPFWSVALVVATALHAGFQLTVTALVYPALARVDGPGFARAHDLHSRGIVPLVGLVYGVVVVSAVGAVVTHPTSFLAWAAALSSAVALATTAFRAAPLHGRLGRRGPEPDLVRALLRADRVRTTFAVLAVVPAVALALSA